ncbi:MAG TPA: hypothetical protein VD789_12100, partial [Thermomicrobiales bacterium]|nr:hypothetical protein [Thermomicrobiales bacterium]
QAVSMVSELPFENAALVIDGSLEHIRWVEVDSRSMMRATISPDGDLVAVAQPTDGGLTVRVEHLADGAVVAETGIDYGAGDTMLLLTDGAGLLHLAPDRLDLVTWDGEATTDTLLTFDAGTGSPILAQTTDPDVVAVGTTNSSGTTMGYLVDVSTGDVTEIPHMLLAPFVHIAYRSNEPVGHVLAAAPTDDGGQATLQMIDVSTGEAALTSEPIDIAAEELSAQAGTLPAKGTRGFVFLPDGQTIVLDAATGEAIHIAPPETDDAMQWTLHPSPAGTYLVPSSSASGDMFVMDLTRGEWRQLPAGTNGWFLPGTGS